MTIFIANQFIGDKISTGGDMVAFEVAKRTKGSKTIIAPGSILRKFGGAIPDAVLIPSDLASNTGTASTVSGGITTVIRYIKRSVTTYRWLSSHAQPDDRIYLTGDFICNTVPAWLIKMKISSLKVLANFYHRNPEPKLRPGNPYLVSWSSRLIQTISLKVMKQCSDTIFVLSEAGKQELIQEGFDSHKLTVSGAGINRQATRKLKAAEKNPRQLVFIGRINITKGAFDLAEILFQVARLCPSFTCFMIGQGSDSDMDRLNRLVARYKLKKQVKIPGYVSEEKKYQVLASSAVLLLPSKEEGFGIVVQEALAVGVPVICYDLPALRMLFGQFPQVTFVPLGNKPKFVQAICETLSQPTPVRFTTEFPTWDDVYKIQARYF